MDPIELLQEFVSLPGPAGQEEAVAAAVGKWVERLGLKGEVDAKGSYIVRLGEGTPRILVTAHMDEIAMIVREVRPDGTLVVSQLGGLFAWKLGEGPVEILGRGEPIPGVFGFGGIHTEDPTATTVQAKGKGVEWRMGSVFTGLSGADLKARGVRPGTRVVVSRSRRNLTFLGDHVAGHFLDDRADLVAWLLVLEEVAKREIPIVFAATAAEEVGGEGALYIMRDLRPEVCIALELGAHVPDARVAITSTPTVWAIDSYSATSAADLDMIEATGTELGMDLQFQAFSRGGSDASCAASHGLCARPLTFGLPMVNSHGYEIMHRDAMTELARLTTAIIQKL